MKAEVEKAKEEQHLKDVVIGLIRNSRANKKLLVWLISINVTFLFTVVGWMFIFVMSQNKNLTTHEYLKAELQKKAARSKLNYSAMWTRELDSNDRRAESYYYMITEPSDITRGEQDFKLNLSK